MLDYRLEAELDRRRAAEIRASLLQGRQPQDRYLTVDARRPGDEPSAATFDVMLSNCCGWGCYALVCCPPESDLPDLIGGKCIVDRKITDGIHRTYLKVPGRVVGVGGRPPRQVPEVAWARVEAAATRAVGARLRDLRGAIATWAGLTPGLRRSDPFGDGERLGLRAGALLAKLEQYQRICGRRDRGRCRTMVTLDAMLREADASNWPAGLLRGHIDELDIFIERAFPGVPVEPAVHGDPLILEAVWDLAESQPSPQPDPGFQYEEVLFLDGRILPVDIGKCRRWEGRQGFDGFAEFFHQRDIHLTPDGFWILRSWCDPADSDIPTTEAWAEVGLDNAARWFVKEWDQDPRRDPMPDVIRARLDSGVPLGRPEIGDVAPQTEASTTANRTEEDETQPPEGRPVAEKPGRKKGEVIPSVASDPHVMLPASGGAPPAASKSPTRSKPEAKPKLEETLWLRCRLSFMRRRDEGLKPTCQAIADELGTTRGTVSKYTRDLRRSEVRDLPRGAKDRDGRMEASSEW